MKKLAHSMRKKKQHSYRPNSGSRILSPSSILYCLSKSKNMGFPLSPPYKQNIGGYLYKCSVSTCSMNKAMKLYRIVVAWTGSKAKDNLWNFYESIYIKELLNF